MLLPQYDERIVENLKPAIEKLYSAFNDLEAFGISQAIIQEAYSSLRINAKQFHDLRAFNREMLAKQPI